ncbi:hypothetical protein BN903_1 [Halorubrum sp. AJ67]|nr:hypothetical protein BN903_1 [Halorubrum sp. AJ67]
MSNIENQLQLLGSVRVLFFRHICIPHVFSNYRFFRGFKIQDRHC